MERKNMHYRLFSIIKYLNEKTTPENPIVINDLLDYLHLNGFITERCTLIRDLNAMEAVHFGVEHKNRKYYFSRSGFSFDELTLLADAICYSGYIDEPNCKKLLENLKNLTDNEHSALLERQTEISVRPKPMNSRCITNAGIIHKAICENRQIRFQYMHYDKNKKLIKKENSIKNVSPYKLVWDNSQYYLLGICKEYNDNLVCFRVDKLTDLETLSEARESLNPANPFYDRETNDIAVEKFLKSTFFMYGSHENILARATLKIHENLIGVFIDKFGSQLPTFPIPNSNFVEVKISVQPSPTFYGWLFQFGKQVEIISSDSSVDLRQEYVDYLQSVLNCYR